MKTTTLTVVTILLLVLGLGIYAIYALLNSPLIPDRGISVLESTWSIRIPDEATDIEYESDIESGYIGLTFNIPPNHISEFVESVCDGNLYQGYDPFNTIDSAQPTDGAILIKMRHFTYYSYAPNTPETISGNRCNATPGEANQVHQFSVDQTDPTRFAIRFSQPGCASDTVRCASLGINYVNPIDDFPLMIVGLQSTEGEYHLIHDEICIDTLLTYVDVSAFRAEWDYLIGAVVQIEVDSMVLPQGIISPQGRLMPVSRSNAAVRNDSYWQYCVKNSWGSDTHYIKISISGTDIIEYMVEFSQHSLDG